MTTPGVLINRFPRETKEFQPVLVEVSGVKTLVGVTFSVVPIGSRPVQYVASVELDGDIGVMVQAMAQGSWRVWALVSSQSEEVVLNCGYFIVT